MALNLKIPPVTAALDDESAAQARQAFLNKIEQEPEDWIGFDTETHGLKIVKEGVKPTRADPLDWMNDTVTFWSLAAKFNGEYKRFCFDQNHFQFFAPVLEHPKAKLAGWNLKYDAHIAWNCGINIWNCARAVDFLMAGSMLDENVTRSEMSLKQVTPRGYNSEWRRAVARTVQSEMGYTDFCDIPREVYLEVQEEVERRITPWEGFQMTPFKALFKGCIDPNTRKPAVEFQTSLYDLPVDRVANYASLDALAHLWLGEHIQQVMQAHKSEDYCAYPNMWDYYCEAEDPITQVLWRLERRGLPLNKKHLEALVDPLEEEIAAITKEINRKAQKPINLRSPQQVANFLYGDFPKDAYEDPRWRKIIPAWTGTLQPKTDAETLELLAAAGNDAAKLINRHRKIEKIYGTYVTKLIFCHDYFKDGRVHTQFRQNGTRTGRCSTGDPVNSQNLPNPENDEFQIRVAFCSKSSKEKSVTKKPYKRKLVCGDYAQLEMRIMAHFCLYKCMRISVCEGDTRAISILVNQRRKPYVRSFDFSLNTHVNKQITNHFKNGDHVSYAPTTAGMKPEDWLIVRHDAAPNGMPLIITPQHRVLRSDGSKIPIGDLEVGDYLLYDEPKLIGLHLQMVIIQVINNKEFKHRIEWKENEGVPYEHRTFDEKYCQFKQNVLKQLEAKNHGSPSLNHIKRRIRPTKQLWEIVDNMADKHRPKKELLEQIGPAGLAIWYCDTGTIYGHLGSSFIKISMPRTCAEDVEILNKLGTNFITMSNGFGLLSKDFESFFQIVGPYIPWCMSYKVPKEFHHYIGTASEEWEVPMPPIRPVTIIEKRPAKLEDLERGYGSKYDIEVEDTHNYFAQNILVSNSTDNAMIDAIWSGKDMHCITVERMWGIPYEEVKEAKKAKEAGTATEEQLGHAKKRSDSKAVGFGIFYGAQEKNISIRLECSRERARELINLYFKAYPKVKRFINETHWRCRQMQFVTTLLGRRRNLPDINSNNFSIRSHAERESVNSIIQGTAADLIKTAMINIEFDDILNSMGVEMINQIHDELTLLGPTKEQDEEACVERIKNFMEHPFEEGKHPLLVPVPVDIKLVSNWGEAK